MTEFTRYTYYALYADGWPLYTADGEALELDARGRIDAGHDSGMDRR